MHVLGKELLFEERWWQVQLSDGTQGWVRDRLVERKPPPSQPTAASLP